MKIHNLKFANSLSRTPQGCPPVWFMRQAGRYHKHYQALRAKHGFMELCKNPLLAGEVTLGPVADFDFDVAILFSDLLFPLEALGMGLDYDDGPPRLAWNLSPDTFSKLATPDRALPHLMFQKAAMEECRRVLPENKSLIGFVGGPWTLFTYAAQGSHDGSLIAAKTQLGLFTQFCEVLVPLLIENIRLQFAGGAEVVMVFDTAAGELMPEIYGRIVRPELEKLARAFPKKLGYYSKHTTDAHLTAGTAGPWSAWAGLGIDHRWDLAEALHLPHTGFTQGCFDQALLFLPEREFKTELMRYLEPLTKLTQAERAGWVCGLGHGVLPKTPEANVRAFVQIVREVFS